jgi:hypothetical protein
MMTPAHDVLMSLMMSAHSQQQQQYVVNLKHSVPLNRLPQSVSLLTSHVCAHTSSSAHTHTNTYNYNSSIQFASIADHTNTVRSKCVIKVIKFDRVGALVAVANADGLVSVYDFDECQYKMMKRYVCFWGWGGCVNDVCVCVCV